MKDPFAEYKQYSGNYSECEMSLQTDNFFEGPTGQLVKSC